MPDPLPPPVLALIGDHLAAAKWYDSLVNLALVSHNAHDALLPALWSEVNLKTDRRLVRLVESIEEDSVKASCSTSPPGLSARLDRSKALRILLFVRRIEVPTSSSGLFLRLIDLLQVIKRTDPTRTAVLPNCTRVSLRVEALGRIANSLVQSGQHPRLPSILDFQGTVPYAQGADLDASNEGGLSSLASPVVLCLRGNDLSVGGIRILRLWLQQSSSTLRSLVLHSDLPMPSAVLSMAASLGIHYVWYNTNNYPRSRLENGRLVRDLHIHIVFHMLPYLKYERSATTTPPPPRARIVLPCFEQDELNMVNKEICLRLQQYQEEVNWPSDWRSPGARELRRWLRDQNVARLRSIVICGRNSTCDACDHDT